MTCTVFDNPVVSFSLSPALSSSSSPSIVIGINTDTIITASVASLYPLTSLQWSIVNQSPSFLGVQKLTTKTLTLPKQSLEYNMKITLKFEASTAKGYSASFLSLQTFTKPSIILVLLVNAKQLKIINHLSDVLTIATNNWPKNAVLVYSITAIGQKTGVKLSVGSGTSNTNLAVSYIFPYLLAEETFSIALNVYNDQLELTVTDAIRVLNPTS